VFRIGGSVIRSGDSTPSSPITVNATRDGPIDDVELGTPERRPKSSAAGEQPGSPKSIASKDVGGDENVVGSQV